MSYLKSKDGSLEASIKEMQKNIKDSAYQDMFKKELEKAGKGIGAMSDQEKKDFFNKIDKMHKAKNEDLDSKDKPTAKDVVGQLKKAVQAHSKQAKDLEKAMKNEAEMPAGPDVDQMHKVKKAKSKDPQAGEKEPMKMNTESLERTIWKMAGDQIEEMMKKKTMMKAQDVAPDNDADTEKDEKKGKTLVGSKQTKVETEPKVDYNK